jgi:hypothetical protein
MLNPSAGKLAQLKIVEIEAMKTVRDLLTKLRQSKEDDFNLLDRTSVFLGSNPGLCNLYVSMLQRLGIETDHFGTSNGTLPGLAMA